MTSRAFFQSIADIIARLPAEADLADFLLRLHGVILSARPMDTLTHGQLLHFLNEARDALPTSLVSSVDYPETLHSRADVLQLLLAQAADLVAMRQAGILDDPECDYGVTSPSGNRWYNVTPQMYLDCAAFGTWPGGMEAHLAAGGTAFRIDMEGNTTPLSPMDVAGESTELADFGWDTLGDFFENGRLHE